MRNALLIAIAVLLALLEWQVYQQGSMLESMQNDLEDIGAYLEDLQQQSEDETSGPDTSGGVVRGSDRSEDSWIRARRERGGRKYPAFQQPANSLPNRVTSSAWPPPAVSPARPPGV